MASAIISGAKLPSFLNVSLSVGTSFNFSFTSFFTLETTSEGNKPEGFIFLVSMLVGIWIVSKPKSLKYLEP